MEQKEFYQICDDDGQGEKSPFIRHLDAIEHAECLSWEEKFRHLRIIAQGANIAYQASRIE